MDMTEGKELPGEGLVAEDGMIALLNKAEIDQQIATAHRYPRSLKKFRDTSLQMVTLTEDIARECIYALPRDGKVIEGPSARFAEVIASAWGNSRAGARVVSDQGDFVTAQGVFHDLEQNVAITYEVQRRITDKNGKRYKTDMIGVTANAACSIALRNAILKGVPKAFWSSIYQAARMTVMGDFKTLANRRAEAFTQFQAFGVPKEKIFGVLHVAGVEDIGLEQLVVLSGLLTAIKEGDTTVEQAFGPNGDVTTIKQPQPAKKQEPKTQEQQPVQEQQPAQVDKATSEVDKATGEITDVGAGEDGAVIAAGLLSVVRSKIAAAQDALGPGAVTEAQVCERFKVPSLDRLPYGAVNNAISYITNPPGV